MPTQEIKDIPNGDYINAVDELSLVVGSKYNGQAVGSQDCVMIESATKPNLSTAGTYLKSNGLLIPFTVESGLGIWLRALGSKEGSMVVNQEGL